MASSSASSCMGLIVVVVVAALLQCTAAATTHTVGDATGWAIPTTGPQFYPNWASGKTFVVGDTLSFTFSSQHDVAKVTKTEYDTCSETPSGGNITTSPANIPLNTTGDHYFICTFPGHCSAGQKLTVNVASSNTTTPTTPPTVPPGGPSPPSAASSLQAGVGAAGIVAAVFTAFFL